MKLKAILIFCLALLPCISALPCTNLLISKGASKDGSVMVTYAADSHTRYGTLVYMPRGSHKPGEMIQIREWGKERLLGEIPQVPYTYNVIGNMNENQVVIGESTWGGLNEMRDTQAILDYGSLIYLSLQRAKTAREAIEIFTSLADKYGYASSGESISIGDPNEVWFLDIIGKKPRMENGVNVNKGVVWVAVRIPNGYISAHANCARIATFPLNDPQNCIYAKDVISHAREIGIYDGSDSDFSFADTYGPLDFSAMRGCEARVWSFFNKHGAEDMSKYLDFASGENPKNRMPLYVKAKSKLSVKNVADMMRDHFEGTPFDMTQDVGAGGNALPYRWRPMSFKVDSVTVTNERAICTQQTGFWFVGQCRGWLPNTVGGVFWFAVDDAGTSPLTPVYTCSNAISNHYALGNGSMVEYSETSMFWLQNRIAQFAYLRYNQIGAEVRAVVDKHENEMIEAVAQADANALKMDNKAIDYLTQFSVNEANALFDKWKQLDKYLLVKYIDGNTKKQEADGAFTTNGHSNRVPVTPNFPGYTEKFKKAIKEDTGNRLLVK
ncbi:MAG: C69 family dipeptidase [Bacteroidales bacterium]